MAIGKSLLIVAAVLVASLAVSCGDDEENGAEPTATTKEAPTSAEAIRLAKVYEQGLDALNRGDVDGVMAGYADDAVFAIIECVGGPCVGREAIRNVFEFYVAEHLNITTRDLEVSGNTLTTTFEIRSDGVRAAGLERILGGFKVEVRDGRISEIRGLPPDFGDPDTAAWYALLGTTGLNFDLAPGQNPDQSPGSAFLFPWNGRTQVMIGIEPGLEGVPQPIHIHEGSCADLGVEVAFPLQDVGGGKSLTIVDVPLAELRTRNFAIDVHPEEGIDVYVWCGDIPPPETSTN